MADWWQQTSREVRRMKRKRKRKKESKSFRRSELVTGLGPIRQLQEHKLELALKLKLKQNAIQCDAMLLYGSSSSSSKESKKKQKSRSALVWSSKPQTE